MKQAFTMIELIFVIVIIGILSAISIPKLAVTRDDATITKIEGNARVVLGDFQMYFMANGHRSWVDETIDNVTNVSLDIISCGIPANSTTQISPNTFVLCHDNTVCLTFITVDENSVTLVNGTVTSDSICEKVKDLPSIKAMSNKSYKLGGSSVVR